MKKIYLLLILLILFLIIWMARLKNNKPDDINLPAMVSATVTPQNNIADDDIINPAENLCPQISMEYVAEVTGVAIKRVGSLNGPQINACDYYLTDDKNAPYIAVIVNKNLNFEKHKQIAIKNKFIVKTDPRISGDHYIAWADHETRISNIDLYIDENSFLRIDKNVERAIDNEGMIVLASSLSKRL